MEYSSINYGPVATVGPVVSQWALMDVLGDVVARSFLSGLRTALLLLPKEWESVFSHLLLLFAQFLVRRVVGGFFYPRSEFQR